MTISSESATTSGSPATALDPGTMHAVVYRGEGRYSWDEVPRPVIEAATDVVVQVDSVTICGTDLHILRGDVPEVPAGRILGHEAVGTVVAVGSGTGRSIGDRVLISCISACGSCGYCRQEHYGLCQGGGGWILGRTIDGTQAEFVRVPFADRSTYLIPPDVSDEEAVMLADIGPTGYEVGVRNGRVEPGDTVVVVGAGPIGLSVIQSARLFSPSRIIAVDRAPSRLEAARRFGADVVVNNTHDDPSAVVRELTGGLGADVAVEAVGVPETFELCTQLIRPAGRVANVGVHGKPAILHLEKLWPRDVTITTGLVDTSSTPVLLQLLQQRLFDTARFITHRFALHEFAEAYDVFSRAAETDALKVVLSR